MEELDVVELLTNHVPGIRKGEIGTITTLFEDAADVEFDDGRFGYSIPLYWLKRVDG